MAHGSGVLLKLFLALKKLVSTAPLSLLLPFPLPIFKRQARAFTILLPGIGNGLILVGKVQKELAEPASGGCRSLR